MKSFSRLVSLPLAAQTLRKKYCVNDPRLRVEKFSLQFQNPVGLAAGFDKDGRWFRQLAMLGFGSIEIGTVTGQPQPGNPKPRLFRLPADSALINRMGFNSSGCDTVADNLAKPASREFNGILGINIGKSKIVPLDEAPAEHQRSFECLFKFADYFTINVSSPNTPNLRQLQDREHLIALIGAIEDSNLRMSRQHQVARKPILLKIAPDLNDAQIDDIANVAQQHGLDGIIATNTTVSRADLKTPPARIEAIGAGGLSGRPLHSRSLEVVARLYLQLQGTIPIVGVGGIMSGADAWHMICAGADLIQTYTGFVYGGPGFVRDINRELLARIEQSGFCSIAEATGKHADQYSGG